MIQTVLGIDISKKDFHVVLMNENKTTKPKVFKNTPQGFESLQTWLTQQGVTKVHACMEATSIYGEALAEFLFHSGHTVSIVNPSRIKGFAKSELIRTKTDKVDAALIARFCKAITPQAWTPLPPEVKELQALLRRLESLMEMYQQEQNRLETATASVAELIESHLQYLQQLIEQVKQLIRDHEREVSNSQGSARAVDFDSWHWAADSSSAVRGDGLSGSIPQCSTVGSSCRSDSPRVFFGLFSQRQVSLVSLG